jgi:hypothetical protein
MRGLGLGGLEGITELALWPMTGVGAGSFDVPPVGRQIEQARPCCRRSDAASVAVSAVAHTPQTNERPRARPGVAHMG